MYDRKRDSRKNCRFMPAKTLVTLSLGKRSQYSNLNDIFNRKTCPSIPTLEKICAGLGISLSEFFEFLKAPKTSTGLSGQEDDIIYSFRSLSKKDKELFQAYLNGLCHKKTVPPL